MQMIEVSKLIPHQRNNEFFDDIQGDNWMEFKKSIETSGVIEPIVITQDKVVVSGHQRVKACKELKINEIPVRIKIYEENERWSKEDVILKELLETNLMQRGIGNLNPIKLARCIKKLERLYGIEYGNNQRSENNFKSSKELAEDLNMTQQQLNNYKRLLNLIPELQSLIEDGELSPTIGYTVLSKLSKEEQQKLINDLGKDYISQLTQKKAEELIKNKENNTINQLKSDLVIQQDDINDLKSQLQQKEKSIDFLKRDKDLLERKVKLNEEDMKRYNNLKQQIDILSKTKEDIGKKIEDATSISGLVIEVEHLLQNKLAPIRYSKAILNMQTDEIVIKNLLEIFTAVESWCNEMRRYLPDDNIINVEVLES